MLESTRLQISKKLKGRKPWNKGLIGVKPKNLSFKGRKHTTEAIEKTRQYFKGRKKTIEHKRKISLAKRGSWVKEKNPRWKGGITVVIDAIRTSFEYRQWRSDVFTRDKFICQHCFDSTGGNLNAHHIKHLSTIISENNLIDLEQAKLCQELWNINNGVTLCETCHREIHRRVL